MSKTVLIEFSPNHPPKEFTVGEFVSIGYPYKTGVGCSPMGKPTFFQFLDWINDLAPKGLVYHSKFNGSYLFRVDGAVIEQLKEKLKLSEDSTYAYAGEDEHGNSAYKANTTMFLHLDGDLLSEVPLP